MSPAFSSPRQALAFSLLLGVLLALPALLGPRLLPTREEVYSPLWWGRGDFPYIDQQIFAEKGDIDIAFMGASRIWYGVDASYVQQRLSEKLARPAVVRTLCWGSDGFDSLYFIARDLMERRQVHLLVFDDAMAYNAVPENNQPHLQAVHFFRYGDDAPDLAGLSFHLQASYYLASVFGLPRNLLGLIRADRPADFTTAGLTPPNDKLIVKHLGSKPMPSGFSPDELTRDVFIPFTPSSPVPAPEFLVYPGPARNQFEFANRPVSTLQIHFMQKLIDLARQHHTGLLLLHMPIYEERRLAPVGETVLWPKMFRENERIAGISPSALFAGLSDQDIRKLYFDPWHFNANGEAWFTAQVAPGLINLYHTGSHD
jgi:hypothetical protein